MERDMGGRHCNDDNRDVRSVQLFRRPNLRWNLGSIFNDELVTYCLEARITGSSAAFIGVSASTL